MRPSQDELWQLVIAERHGVLATINGDGSPHLTNVLYLAELETRTIRISTTADRIKARNLARDTRAALHVAGENFWRYAVAHGQTSRSPVATAPGDHATDELFTVHTAFYSDLARAGFDEEMINQKRLVIRLHVTRLTGVITGGGRRPVSR
jgi:PPOX class probable F420-dependent enzyme